MTDAALDKPIDLGNGSICASFGASGAWLSVGGPHPVHGFVELNALPPFEEAWRADPDATRRYRSWMTDERYAFLRLEVAGLGPIPPLAVDVREPSCPRWRGRFGEVAIEVEAMAGADHLVQRWRFEREDGEPLGVRCVVTGRLDRPALAEITEVNPPSPTGARTALRADGPMLAVAADSLPAHATISLDRDATWRVTGDSATLEIGAADALELTVSCSLHPALPGTAADGGNLGSEPLVRRAVAYVRGCTALAVASDERVILTDHRILPLSWTRDAYYQALLLLATGERANLARVADHLRWLWTRCERPDGRWMRSHHADGRRKDLAFQADEQLYPILELTDYWRAAGELPSLSNITWSALMAGAWAAALAERDPHSGLMRTAETAADDPAAAPFICASQILLWYAASRLAQLADEGVIDIDPDELRRLADTTRHAVENHLVVDGPFGPQWAYAIDGAGQVHLYHDANDLPTALAPAWGFCDADDPVWRSTLRFAFSSHNPGFFAGARPGLGSVHTPAPWTLGDVQWWLVGRLTDDRDTADAALQRLRDVAFADGMLPEAYDPADARRRVRHWFAWPAAVAGALMLLDQRGELIERLRA